MNRLVAVLLALVLFLGGGCQPPDTGEKLTIAVIPKGTTHEFWKSVHYGARKAAEEFQDIDVEVIWKGPQLENDRDGQITTVQNFVTRQVDGIVLAPLDSQALVAPVRDAKKAGIPTVIFDSGLDNEEIIVSYVATDNFHGGELAAEEMAKQLNEKGKVILLRYTTGSESTEQREEGFLSKIKEYPGIEVISSDQYAGTTPESSLDKAQQMVGRYSGQFDGIFAVCEPNAMGVLGALEDLKQAGQVVFVGFDPSPRMVQALADGRMQAIVLQDPVTMGYEAVKTMVAHLQGKEVEKRKVTGEYVATKENMIKPRMKELLNPPQEE
jgi:ribose transport system substrate-binding protein